MATLPRLYTLENLSSAREVELSGNQAHYLARVMRLTVGDQIRVFNSSDGEWLAEVSAIKSKRVFFKPVEQRRKPLVESQTGPVLIFAPLKKSRTDFVIEKATEMGAAEIHPVITDRTQTKTVRTDRLVSLSVEAAEQTERMDVPEISDAKTLRSAINNFNGHVFFCDEAGDNAQDVWGGESGRAPGFAEIGVSDAGKTRTGILVGPEGGFSPDEREWLRSLDFVTPITLGPRILRAETAVVAALTIWQALAGDWRQAPREN